MLNKKLMILVIFFVSLLAVSAVSAADNVTGDIVNVEKTDEVVIISNNNVNNSVNSNENNYMLSIEDQNLDEVGATEENKLSGSAGTFTDLYNEIQNAGDELNLTRDYIYSEDIDFRYDNGTFIGKKITINGNGFTIRNDNGMGCVWVYSDNVILKNFNFINSMHTIVWAGNNGAMINCSFINCHQDYDWGAMYLSANNISLINCNFVNCSSCYEGGAIIWYGDNGNVSHCNFTNCHADGNGGAIYYGEGDNLFISDCNFVNNTASIGNAIYFTGQNGKIINSNVKNEDIFDITHFEIINNTDTNQTNITTGTFTDLANDIANAGDELNLTKNYVYSTSDQIYKNGIIVNKKITINGNGYEINGNNKVRAFNVTANNVILNNINFVNCSAVYYSGVNSNYYSSYIYGGAVYWGGDNGKIVNCSFLNCFNSNSNSFYTNGGAVYWYGNRGSLSNCSFVNCSASSSSSFNYGDNGYVEGGAVYWYGNYGSLSDCSFVNCSSSSSLPLGCGGAVYWDGKYGSLSDCSFVNCFSSSSSSSAGGGAVYWDGNRGSLSDCCFVHCSSLSSSSSAGGGAVYWDGTYGSLSDCSFMNCSSVEGGGIYWNAFLGFLSNNSFEYCYSDWGSAIYGQKGHLNLYNISVVNCRVHIGAIYIKGENCNLTYSNFKNCYSADFGRTIYWSGANGILTNSNFVNCKVAIEWNGENGNLIDCTFSRCYGDYAVYWTGNNGVLLNCTSDKTLVYGQNYKVLKRSFISLNNLGEINFGDSVILKPQVTSGASGYIEIYIDNIYKTSINCISSYSLTGLAAGDHTIKTVYLGNDYYAPCENLTLLRVNKINTTISVFPSSVTAGNTNLTIILNNETTGIIVLNVNNNNYSKILVDGKADFNINDLPAGNYNYTIVYSGDENFNKCFINSNISIQFAKSNLNLEPINNYIGKIINITYNITDGATGVLSVCVEDTFVKNISVGQPISLEGLKAGNYIVKIVYSGDGYYAPCENTTHFEVFKYDSNFTVSANDITAENYDEFETGITAGNNVTFKFMLNNDANGSVYIVLKHYGDTLEYSGNCTLVNGVASFTIPNIRAGAHEFTLNYGGNYKYNPFECDGNIYTEYKYAPVDFEVHDVIWGDSIMITPILPQDMSSTTVVVDLHYPGEENLLFSDSINLGESCNLTFLYGGNLIVHVWTFGDEYYGICGTEKEIYVHKLNSTCSISDTVEAGDSVPITLDLNEDATGNVSVTINHNTYSAILANGTFAFEIPNIKAGTYDAIINYGGDTKYNSFYTTKTVNVTYKKSDINLVIKNILTGNNIVIMPEVTSGATGNIKICYDDVLKSTISIGSSYTLVQPEIGKHEVKAVYSGDDYFASSQITTVFRVFAIYPIDSQNMQILYNSGEYFRAKFYDEYGNILINKYIVFNVNGTDYAKQTNENGIAVLDLNLPIGSYDITITNPTVNENIKKNLLIFSSIKASDMVRAYNSGVDFNATFLDGSAKALSNSYVIFKVNGTDYPVFSDINGGAVLNVPLAVGTYEVISINTETNENTSNRLTILPTVQAIDMTKAFNSSIDYKATFFDKDGNALVNTEVTFEIGVNTYKVITNNNGQAFLNVPLAVGEYNITAVNPVTGERSIKRLTILPRLIENKDMTTFSDSQDYFTVKVIDDDGNVCGSGETVVFNLNNTVYNVKTNNNGYASLKISLDKGVYPITATYKGFTVTNDIVVFEELNSIISINVNDAMYNQIVLLNVSVSSEFNEGNITVSILGDNGYIANFTQKSDQIFTKDLKGLDVSNYVVSVDFSDNDNYYFSHDTKVFEVSKNTPNLIVVAYDAEYGQNATITINIPQVSGNVTTKIGNKYEFTDFIPEDGVIVKRINTLEIGEYQVEVTYNGNDNYRAVTKTAKLNITKIATSISVETENVDYGESFILNITASVDGSVRVQINDDVQFISVKANEVYKLVCDNYDAGDYDVIVNLTPNDNHYDVSSYSGQVCVYVVPITLYIYSYDIEIGHPTDIVVTLDKNATGIVRLELNNTNYTEEIINDTVKFNIDGLGLGNYTVYAYFEGNDNYCGGYDWDTFEVTRIENIEVDIPESIENKDDNLSFNLPSDASGNVTVTIEGRNFTSEVIKGNVSIDLSDLTNGDYDYALTYSGDDKYAPFTRYGTLNIDRIIDTVISQDMIVDYDENYDFKATFLNSEGSPLSNAYIVFNVNNDEYPIKTDSKGLAVLNIGLKRGTYNITSINSRTGETKINRLTIIGGPEPIINTTITASDINMTYGDETYLVATLKDMNGEKLIGKELIILINGQTIKDNTDGNGQVKILIDLSPNTYPAVISFRGNEEYGNSTKIVSVIVNKIESEIVIPPLDNITVGESVTVTLPIDAKGTVTLTINGVDYPFNVINGIASVIIPDLENGDYPYNITYSGDEKYSSFTNVGSLNITKEIIAIEANDMAITYGSAYDFMATFFDSNGLPLVNKFIAFKVNEVEYPVKTDSNGVAKLVIGLNPGEYDVTSINDYVGVSIVNKLIVKAAGPKPIDDKNITIPSLDGGSGTIQLPKDASGTITLDVAGKKYDFSVVNGIANVKLPDLTNGAYGYILTYSGDGKYSSFSKTGSLTVNNPTTPAKPVTKTTLALKKVKVKRASKKLTIQATLKINGKAVKGKLIKFKINKKSYKAKTNAKGVAKITVKKSVLKKLKKGKKVTYTATYDKITKKVTVKVK